MSNVKRGNRAVFDGDRPLKVGETIEEQADGTVLSVIRKEPRTVTDPKTGIERELPSSDARTSRVDMKDDRLGGLVPWYIKHMVPSEKRAEVVAHEAGLKEAEAAARLQFETARDAARPLNPIRARTAELEALKAATKSKKVKEKAGE